MGEWLAAYLLTCAIEIPIVVWLLRKLGWRSSRFPSAAVLAWLLQLTHPLLWLARPSTLPQLFFAELMVMLIEGGAVYWWATRRAEVKRSRETVLVSLAIAFAANVTSLFIGLLIQVLVSPV